MIDNQHPIIDQDVARAAFVRNWNNSWLEAFVDLLGIILGVAGLVFMLISPGFGLLLLVIGTLFFLAESNAKKRRAAQTQATIEERRHQELLEAVRQGKSPVVENKPPSIWQRNK